MLLTSIALKKKLIVEIDGRDHSTEQGRVHDEARDRFMHSQGIRVLRFTGKQVETETEWVLAQIDQVLGSSAQAPHPPPPSPRVRGEGSSGYFCGNYFSYPMTAQSESSTT